VLLIVDGVVHHLGEDTVACGPVLVHKVLVALLRADYKVHEHADFVSQALVVLLVALLHDLVELGLQAGDGLGVASQVGDGNFATDLNQVPKRLNCKRNNVGSEVFALVDDANQVAANTDLNNLLGDRLVVADGS